MALPVRRFDRRHTVVPGAPPALATPGLTTTVTPNAQRPTRVSTPGLNLPPQVNEVDPSNALTFPRQADGTSAFQFG